MQHKTERDYDPYQRVLNVTTHNDTLYAYYYTNNQPDNIENMQELLEIDKNINVNRTGLEQQHKKVPAPAIVNNWNSLQSGKIYCFYVLLNLFVAFIVIYE